MKTKNLLILSLSAFFFLSCEKELKEEVDFDISVNPANGISMDKDTIVVDANTPVVFNIGGEPDFLTFFSGEEGHVYEYRNRTQLDINSIETSRLTFSSWGIYGDKNIPGSMKVYISTTFDGVSGNDFEADSIAVETMTNWTDITTECNIPQVRINSSDKAYKCDFDMTSYLGKRIVLAFCFKTTMEGIAMPTWHIQNMQLENAFKDGRSATLGAATMSFTPMNMYYKSRSSSDLKRMTKPYESVTGTSVPDGVWNLGSMDHIQIKGGGAGLPMNYNWLVSAPLVVNGCSPDTGVGIKDMTQRLASYTYTYETPGLYQVVFVGNNVNYVTSSRQAKSLWIRVK